MKYIFFGTPKESVIALDLLKAHNLIPSLVVTSPDRPSGRGLKITESAVAIWANENKIETLKPENLNEPSFIENLKMINPDFAIVFAYGKIIPKEILVLPHKGVLNIHPSLLPKYRGPAPVEGALLNNEEHTGVTVMLMDEKMDHGPILAQEKTRIDEEILAPELLKNLIKIGTEKLIEILPKFLHGEISPLPQIHSEATFTKKIIKPDGEINLNDNAQIIFNKYRAYSGGPGIYFFDEITNAKTDLHNKIEINNRTTENHLHRVVIKKARLENGKFIIERVLPEGRKEIDYSDYMKNK